MQTSEMLMKNWDDPEKYTGNVLKEFKWMTKERRALERLLNGRMPTLSNVLTFKQHSKRAGIDISISHLVSLFRKMLEI